MCRLHGRRSLLSSSGQESNCMKGWRSYSATYRSSRKRNHGLPHLETQHTVCAARPQETGWKRQNSSFPREAASTLFDTLPQIALLIQLMEGCYFSTIKCYILETLKQILISSKHPTCLCHKFLGRYGRRFKIA